MNDASAATGDLVDRLAGIDAASPLHAVRHARDKVVAATQGSYDALFDATLADPTLEERLLVALAACALTPAPALAAHYRARLQSLGTHASRIALAESREAGAPGDARLAAILRFTRTLIERPIEGDRAALLALPAAGLTTPAVVALAQLVAFLSYQVRLVAGLAAMKASAARTGAALAGDGSAGGARTGGAMAGAASAVARTASASTVGAATATGTPLRIHGFTNESLEWRAWLDVVELERATPEQIAVLEESHPKAKISDYYRLLVHQPRILRERSTAFNAIMYAPGGLARAERELGATVTSRINGCVYCASVHAQRFEQLAKRNDAIAQVFEDPYTAGTSEREREEVRFSIALTRAPAELGAADIDRLRAVGLSDAEILDLVHSIAIFAWANRLMLNLGEPVFPTHG